MLFHFIVSILYNRNKRFQREVFAFDDRSEDIEMKSKKDGKRYEQKTSNGVGSMLKISVI